MTFVKITVTTNFVTVLVYDQKGFSFIKPVPCKYVPERNESLDPASSESSIDKGGGWNLQI